MSRERFSRFRSQSAPFITLVQRYVSTKLEVSMAFLLRENRRLVTDGRGRGATLNAVSYGGPHNNENSRTVLCINVMLGVNGLT